ncbi:MAG: PEGA domain-containing protein, partial [Polyangiaceae bacterium]
PAPALREVLVSVTPADATIERDGANVGAAPIALHLADGESADLVLSHKGYRSKTIHVDGTEPKLLVTLEVLPVTGAGAPVAPGPAAHKPGHDDVSEFSKSF